MSVFDQARNAISASVVEYSELMGEQEIQPNKKTPWQTPTVTEISRFDILALAPVPGPVEDATYYLKS